MQQVPCGWAALIPSSICCTEWDDYSPELQVQAINYAALVLWAATGRRFGPCEMTVRPCGAMCNDCPQGYYYDLYGGTWLPYIWNGEWHNCWCGSSWCTCDPACQVYLPGPVDEIIEVRVNGEILPASGGAYFVLDQQFLVRVDTDACWPLCTDQSKAYGDPDAFEVTYTRGIPIPEQLIAAAGVLACEYAKACVGSPCRLPGRVASISRQGVNINMVDVNILLANGLTGLAEVDQVIVSLNPYALKGRTRYYSPDLDIPRQITWY